MIFQTIPKINCHVLFCEYEEQHGIGASKFVASDIRPNVRYIIELDRKRSDDAVFYECENQRFQNFITDGTGFQKADGTFSDISIIAPHLDIAAVNLSCGYEYAHKLYEEMHLDVMERNVGRVISILHKYCGVFPYVE